jgi:hypothetical protein
MATLTCNFTDNNDGETVTINGVNVRTDLFSLTSIGTSSGGNKAVYQKTDLGTNFSLTITDNKTPANTIYSGTTSNGVLPQPNSTPTGYSVTVTSAGMEPTPPDNTVKVTRP